MEYGAIDLHTRRSQIRIVSEDGTVVLDRRIETRASALAAPESPITHTRMGCAVPVSGGVTKNVEASSPVSTPPTRSARLPDFGSKSSRRRTTGCWSKSLSAFT